MPLSPNWSTLLLAGKWCLSGLLYAALLVVLVAVRREMAGRAAPSNPGSLTAPGRLRLLSSGSDSRLRAGQVLALEPQTTLGAAAGNTLVLTDEYVSAQHARLDWDGVHWSVEDLGSGNGTLIDGRLCPSHSRQPLPFGATLSLGHMTFELIE